jgi:hypothetical protein
MTIPACTATPRVGEIRPHEPDGMIESSRSPRGPTSSRLGSSVYGPAIPPLWSASSAATSQQVFLAEDTRLFVDDDAPDGALLMNPAGVSARGGSRPGLLP